MIRTLPIRLCRGNVDVSLQRARRSYATASSRNTVRIVEVGPRDGLQGIAQSIPTATKVELIQRLIDTGLTTIEPTSCVPRKWVPQLADCEQVLAKTLTSNPRINFPVLTPNLKGLETAVKAGAKEVLVFASVDEDFSQANQACGIDEALSRARAVSQQARQLGIKVRGMTSFVFGAPNTAPAPHEKTLDVIQKLLDMGCYEVGLGDTLGTGTSQSLERLLDFLLPHIPAEKLAGHFHDTYGQGVANVVKAYEMGLRTFDSSIAGLGGCPFAKGAQGNVATEDVVYTLESMGVSTGVDLQKLVNVGRWISAEVKKPHNSRVATAILSARSETSKQEDATRSKEQRQMRSWITIEDRGDYRISRSGIAVKVTLCRPRNGNALTNAMLTGLTEFFEKLPQDPSIYHVIIESEGKFFCTGMDLSGGTDTATMSSESSYYSKVVALYDAIEHAPQTTIALVDGPCFGGGVGLTFVCDVRLTSPRARWTLSEIKIGVSPAIISKYLVREWGASMAREGMISGREITPDELLRVGAIHSIDEDLNLKLNDYLDQLDKCAPRSAAINKELARLGWYDPEGQTQASLIEKTFGEMMAPGSEGEHGIGNFRKKVKSFSWAKFWEGRSPVQDLMYQRRSPRKSS